MHIVSYRIDCLDKVCGNSGDFGAKPHSSQVREQGRIQQARLGGEQGRLIQWARWARAQGPQASGGPQTAHALVFIS